MGEANWKAHYPLPCVGGCSGHLVNVVNLYWYGHDTRLFSFLQVSVPLSAMCIEAGLLVEPKPSSFQARVLIL